MRGFFAALTVLILIGLAYWAYRENYQTQAAQAEAREMQRQIADARSRLRVLNAEWAYLNRPERLRDLVELNFTRLGLLPLEPHQFGRIEQALYPSDPRVVEFLARLEAEAGR